MTRPPMNLARLLCVCLLGWATGLTMPASARQVIDCPLRDAPYSIDSPLIDVLLKPEAKAAVEHEAPTLLEKIPPQFARTTPPAFS